MRPEHPLPKKRASTGTAGKYIMSGAVPFILKLSAKRSTHPFARPSHFFTSPANRTPFPAHRKRSSTLQVLEPWGQKAGLA